MSIRRYAFAACILAAALSHAPAAFADDMAGMDMSTGKPSPAADAYMEAMRKMMATTDSMKPTGDPDMDFVMMMKPHHEAAVEMAKAYLKFGSDPKLTAMAKSIIASQSREIGEMDRWQKAHEH